MEQNVLFGLCSMGRFSGPPMVLSVGRSSGPPIVLSVGRASWWNTNGRVGWWVERRE